MTAAYPLDIILAASKPKGIKLKSTLIPYSILLKYNPLIDSYFVTHKINDGIFKVKTNVPRYLILYKL